MKAAVKRTRGRPRHADLLTPSEWRTVHAVQHGLTNAEIARRRGVSVDAVKFHVANALAKLGLPDRKALRAWFRAPRDGAMAAQLAGQESKSMNDKPLSGAIGQIARSVSDIGTSETWYRDVLGLPHLYTFGTLAFFDCGGTRLMLAQEKSGAVKESLLYLRVTDMRPGARNTGTARRAVHARAPHDPSARRRHRGMDGVLRGSGRTAARPHVADGAGPGNRDKPDLRAMPTCPRFPGPAPSDALHISRGFFAFAHVCEVRHGSEHKPRRNLCRASHQRRQPKGEC